MSGTVVVTMDKAAIWVDGRYHTQVDIEVDCGWTIMKYGGKYHDSIARRSYKMNEHAIISQLRRRYINN